MSISALATFRCVEFTDNHQIGLFVTRYHHLGNTLTIVDDEIFL